MKENLIDLEIGLLEPVYYNMEPFELTHHSDEYKQAFKEECKTIFKDIGEEHIPKILTYFFHYRRYLEKHQVFSKKHLRDKGLFLLKLLNSDDIFDEKTTYEKLQTYFDEDDFEGAIWETDFNPKKHTKSSLESLKDVLWRGNSIKVQLEDGRFLSLLPKTELIINLKFTKSGYSNIEDVETIEKVFGAFINQKLSEMKQTRFHEILLKYASTDKWIYVKPDFKALRDSLDQITVDIVSTDLAYILVNLISKYLHENTELKSTYYGIKSIETSIPRSHKEFLFKLFLLIGLIKAPKANVAKPYKIWNDYLKRKSLIKEAGRTRTSKPIEIEIIDTILRHKC